MPNYFAVVKVEPPGAVLTIADPRQPLSTTYESGDKRGVITFLTAKPEAIVVRMDANWVAPLSEARVIIEHYALRLYAVVSLLSNQFMQIYILSVTNVDSGEHEAFRPSWPILDTYSAETHRNPDALTSLVHLGLGNGLLSVAIEDLRLATGHLWSGPFFCYRAIESVRQHFRRPEDGDNKNSSWDRMRAALRLEESYTRFLWDASIAIRHGEVNRIDIDLSIQCLAHVRNILFRFIEFLQVGALDETRFPVLAG